MTYYSVMPAEDAGEIRYTLVRGVSLSVDGTLIIAKMLPGQSVPGVENINEEDARALMLTPEWASEVE